ncbi:MAG: class I SAM-dependent methyltransferase [Clostridia bacterium]|nr:class I SAM-dependent methyltransferase [Clostridia bacterium]
MEVINHYDLLIEEENDPFRDPPILQEYMSQWDGARFIEAMELTKSKKVLEIGIGTGRIAVKVAPFCMNLTGIDVSPKTIKRAKENLKEHTNIVFICDDFNDYQFSGTFDVIYSSLTMMHFKHKKQVVTKIDTLLSKNGIFCLSIDKNQSEYIDIGTRKIRVYPDTLENIKSLIMATAMSVSMVFETDNAYIIVSKK